MRQTHKVQLGSAASFLKPALLLRASCPSTPPLELHCAAALASHALREHMSS
jgi:hypothetical protein